MRAWPPAQGFAQRGGCAGIPLVFPLRDSCQNAAGFAGATKIMSTQQFWRDDAMPYVESRRAQHSRACYRAHSHPTLSIGAVDAGASVLQLAGRDDQPLQAGDVVVIPANCMHACNPRPDAAWSYQMLHLDTRWLASLRQEVSLHADNPASCAAGHCRDPATYRAFCRLNQQLFSPAPVALKEAWLIAFVSDLMWPSPAADAQPPAWLPALCQRLREQCDQAWPVDSLAASVGLSRSHFIRLFRQHVGMTPHAYLLDSRILRARQLLCEGHALADLAHGLGFSDQSHFQHAFRDRVAVTPGEYLRGMGVA